MQSLICGILRLAWPRRPIQINLLEGAETLYVYPEIVIEVTIGISELVEFKQYLQQSWKNC